jgi:glutamate/tyrosine decarboxylase-like PLP-dependent enzyme
MFLPYGTGALLVRDGQRLREAHEIHGPYLQDLAPEADIPNFSDYSAELSRDARGLRVWMPIMVHGLGAFREALDEKLDLTGYLYEALRETPGIEGGPTSGVVGRHVSCGVRAGGRCRCRLGRASPYGQCKPTRRPLEHGR